MHSQRKGSVKGVLLATFVGVAIGATGYYLFIKSELSPTGPIGSTTASTSILSTVSTASSTASTTSPTASSSATQIDTSDWKTYTNYELGFSVQYPPDLVVDTSNPAAFGMSFPRATYFSTVYGDDVSVDIDVNATCTPIIAGGNVVPPQDVTIGGVNFTRYETSDIGAGNVYDTVLYDALNNNVCYQITFTDHHANGAGLYAGDDQTQIAALTDARDSEFAHVTDIVNAIISSFNFVSTPAGENEADYEASTHTSPAVATTSIFISTVSPSTLSVGDEMTIIGQGFLASNTQVQISNGSVVGVLWEGTPTSDTSISTTIPSQACTIYVGTSGATCPSYLVISPGVYAVSVSNQNGTTDISYINIQ